MTTKQLVYQKRRQEGRNSSITHIENILYHQMCIEEYKADIEDTLGIFVVIWGPVNFELINLFQR